MPGDPTSLCSQLEVRVCDVDEPGEYEHAQPSRSSNGRQPPGGPRLSLRASQHDATAREATQMPHTRILTFCFCLILTPATMCLEIQALFVVKLKPVMEENQVGPNMPTMIDNNELGTFA